MSSRVRSHPTPAAAQADGAASSHRLASRLALAKLMLAAVGLLVVLGGGLWLTRDMQRGHTTTDQDLVVGGCLAALAAMVWLTNRFWGEWRNSREGKPVGAGFYWAVGGGGLLLMLVVAPVVLALGAPEWAAGEVGLVGFVLAVGAGVGALLRPRAGAAPGSGAGWNARVLRNVVAAPGNLPPVAEEEQALAAAIATMPRNAQVLLANPTVARQAELHVGAGPGSTAVRLREVLGAVDAHLVGDWSEPDRSVLRAWWWVGHGLNRNPVVATVWIGPDGAGSGVVLRAAAKVWLTNRDTADRAVRRLVDALGAASPVAT